MNRLASELTNAELNEIERIFMHEHLEAGVKPADRDGSQKHNIRLWYSAITRFLLVRQSAINRSNDSQKSD